VSGKEEQMKMTLLSLADAGRLEKSVDVAEAALAPLKNFVLPGGSPGSAMLHLARTVARRAERAVLDLDGEAAARQELVIYLNRLSDLLFVLARRANAFANVPDVAWAPVALR
jgi:cob(I)alamin adenosyltransferase